MVQDATAEYQTESDPLAEWIEECCDIHPTCYEKTAVLYNSYFEWAAKQNIKPIAKQRFGRSLTARGINAKTGVTTAARSRQGIGLKDNPGVQTEAPC